MMAQRPWRMAPLLLAAALLAQTAMAATGIAVANKVSDVRGTKHNLSAAATGSTTPTGGKVPARLVRASSETQVCVFCHTPHSAEAIVAPLWNRKLSGQTYVTYSSSSIEADSTELASGPGGSSKLCLSCHDGTMGIDKVNALNGAKDATIAMAGAVSMPNGAASTGFTRDLTTDLSNDHPISFTYNSTLAGNDGELRIPDGSIVGNRLGAASPPKLPLENGQIQCATCHDPHLRDRTESNGNAKFLRMNRFQVTQPSGAAFSPSSDIICLACHDKAGASWAFSVHANSGVATQTYKPDAAQLREFPSSLDATPKDNPPVWQVACLNCHDTHTTSGARRLLREGTDKGATPKAALEQTCYQCHSSSAESAVNYTALSANAVPDIKTDFGSLRAMPITRAGSFDGLEVHDIGGVFNDGLAGAECGKTNGKCGKDMVESRTNLGALDVGKRHAECTDCHNPHRVIKGQNGLPGPLTASNTNQKAGTHRHENADGYVHTNIISGVLRGAFGIQPLYPDNSFHSMPSSFQVKRGDPATSSSTLVTESYVTREYQICLKCHSNYGYPDDNLYPNGSSRPPLGDTGLTPQDSNGHSNFTRYTNQAKEFQAPATHAVQIGSVSKGNDGGTGTVGSNANNHRSWHPVMAPTGRTGRPASGFLAPWNNSGAIGNQTMMCSDCHGTATATATVMPTGNTATNENGKPWGPHGSDNNFLLKGDYSTSTGAGQEATGLCFKCHNYGRYATKDGGGGTGFSTDKGDGHSIHADRIDNGIKCNFCHVAVPHGWKNRGLLMNLLDVGAEAGLAAGTAVSYVNNVGYSNGPYYRNAYLRVISFPSGQWKESNCNGGSKDTMKTNCEKAN